MSLIGEEFKAQCFPGAIRIQLQAPSVMWQHVEIVVEVYVTRGLDLHSTRNMDMQQMSEMASGEWGLREVTGSRVGRMGEVDG